MSQAFVDAQITGHAFDITATTDSVEREAMVRRLYLTFTQPGLDRALARTTAGRKVQRIAEELGL